jgi:hypothetical protein
MLLRKSSSTTTTFVIYGLGASPSTSQIRFNTEISHRFTAATAIDEKAAIANTMIREMAIHADAEYASLCIGSH